MAGLLKLESILFIGCLAADTLSAVQLLGQKRHNKTGKKKTMLAGFNEVPSPLTQT